MFPGRRFPYSVLIASILTALSAPESSAEWYANLSSEGSLTMRAPVNQDGQESGLDETAQFFGLDLRPQASPGAVWPGLDLLPLRTQFMMNSTLPESRLQPFLSLGPALLSTRFTAGANCVPNGQTMNSSPLPLGLKLESGVGYEISKWLSLFTEYGFTRLTAGQSSPDTFSLPALEPYSFSVNQHHFTLGFTHKFE